MECHLKVCPWTKPNTKKKPKAVKGNWICVPSPVVLENELTTSHRLASASTVVCYPMWGHVKDYMGGGKSLNTWQQPKFSQCEMTKNSLQTK